MAGTAIVRLCSSFPELGSPNRIQNAREALSLKAGLQKAVREVVSVASVSAEPKAWAEYVDAALGRLTRRSQSR